MITFLTTIGSIAASLALQDIVDRADAAAAKGKGLGQDEVLAIVNDLLDQASAKGSKILAKVTNKLNSIKVPYSMSGAVKSYINKARNKAQKRVDDTTNKLSEFDQKSNTIRNRAQTLATSSDRYKQQYGEEDLNKIKHDASKAASIIGGIEQYV